MHPLRLGGVPEHFNLPWRLAIEEGLVEGDAVTWTDCLGGTGEMVELLGDGELDVVSILTEGVLAAIAQGLDAVVIQVYVSSPLQWGVYVHPDSDIERVDQAVEQSADTGHDAPLPSIAISRLGSGSHLMPFFANSNGRVAVDAERFVVTGGLDGARKAIAERRADVFFWDQFMTRGLVESGEFAQIGVVPTPWPAFVIAARREALLGRTTEVGRVVDAVTTVAADFHARPGVAEVLADRYGLTLRTATAWLAETSFATRGAVDPEMTQGTLGMLRQCGALRPSVDGE